jgi:hypothetical protein
MYRRPSFEEIAERLAFGPPRLYRTVDPVPVAEAIAVAEPVAVRAEPETPGRLTRCGECGYLGGMLGHVWACLAPNGRWRR